MIYYACEGSPNGKYNASTKAREDVEYILKKKGFKEYYIQTKYGVQTNKLLKIKQMIDYYRNYKIWMKAVDRLQKDDTLIIQYPLVNSMLKFRNVVETLKNKGIKTIIIIHDLDSLRFTDKPRVVLEDKNVLKEATYVIAHNKKMKEKIIDMCSMPEDKIAELEIFDYITEKVVANKARKKSKEVIIAGNLAPEKAGYLKELKDIQGVTFNLYGVGYEAEGEENIKYKGAFLPEELINNLDGSFRLNMGWNIC